MMSGLLRWGSAAAMALACSACADVADGGIVLFNRNYSVETVATEGGEVVSPDGLVWRKGFLYVADEGGSAVRRLGPGGWETLADSRSGLVSPEEVVVTSDGSIYVTDDSAGGLWAVADGSAKRLDSSEIGEAPTEGLAVGSGGELVVGNTRDGRLVVVAGKGGPLSRALEAAKITKPESIAFDPAGNVLVADNEDDVIHRFAAGTGIRTQLSWPEVSPESIAFVGSALWITDSHNGKVYRLKDGRDLETVAQFAGKLGNVSGFVGDPLGSVYISIQTDLEAGKGLIVALRKHD